MKKITEDYFTFTRTDRLGAIGVMVLLLAILFLPKLYVKPQPQPFLTADSALLAAVNTQPGENENRMSPANEDEVVTFPAPSKPAFSASGALFRFDPNTLSTEGWQRLGLNDRIIKTINNYRNKGGRFYKKEDLKKIWGLPPAFYQRVEAYISIASAHPQYANQSYTAYTKPERKIALVEINSADTTAFIALPGIGSKLAARIVNFRQKLGGFYSVEQVGETWGLNDSTFQAIKKYLQLNQPVTRKFNINQASKDDLKMHPYLKWKLASAIVDYRIRHGAYTSLQDLKNIADIDERTFEKIKHYLSL